MEEAAKINATLANYQGTFNWYKLNSGAKKTPTQLEAPWNFEYDNMILSYAEAFGKLPKEVENEITELEWYEWFCYRFNKDANELFQTKPKK